MSDVLNFNPNVNLCGNTSKKTVRLTFGLWQFRLTVEEVVGGNTSGLSVIECAVSNYYDKIYETGLVMTDGKGDTLLCEDDEEDGERWLMQMLISAEIIALNPDPPHGRRFVTKPVEGAAQ